ncbi:hypothetical protein [Microlunatus parietis]|uniref:Uncharacterized protein n=1 Tax=Microlunatus parietis TaxID=682979 RepID=A0A7Y9LEV4_9ACTN|nr:hypothetical protein [Microlunatus parietis]NYE73426.1 hypothetical protein [Microlunatus parietis]
MFLVVTGIWCARPLLPRGTLALRRGLGATVGLSAVLSVHRLELAADVERAGSPRETACSARP